MRHENQEEKKMTQICSFVIKLQCCHEHRLKPVKLSYIKHLLDINNSAYVSIETNIASSLKMFNEK